MSIKSAYSLRHKANILTHSSVASDTLTGLRRPKDSPIAVPARNRHKGGE